MQLQGQSAVFLNKQKWIIPDSAQLGVKSLRRIIGPQIYKISLATPVPEIATFWLTGGTNFQGKNLEVPYNQANGKILPRNIGCTVVKIAPPPNTCYTDVFRVTTISLVILIFRFSPVQNFPPTVELDPASESFTGELSVLSPQPASDQNPLSTNGHYTRSVREFPFTFSKATMDTSIPQPLRRIIGDQTWFLGIVEDGIVREGGIIAVNYGDSNNYIGIVTSTGLPRVHFTDGITVVPLPIVNNSVKYPRVFRWTAASNIFDIWIDPDDYAPTIRSVGPLLPLNSSLVVKIQKIYFNS